jgi:hypothetical protein
VILFLQSLLTIAFAYVFDWTPAEIMWSFWIGCTVAGAIYIAFGFGLSIRGIFQGSEGKSVTLTVITVTAFLALIFLATFLFAQSVLGMILWRLLGLPLWSQLWMLGFASLILSIYNETRRDREAPLNSPEDFIPLGRSIGPFLFAILGIGLLTIAHRSRFECCAFAVVAFFPYRILFKSVWD